MKLYLTLIFTAFLLFIIPTLADEVTMPRSDLVEKEMERLESALQKHQEGQSKSRIKLIGGKVKEFRFAAYMENWAKKVEKAVNENLQIKFKGQKLFGEVQVTVSIKSNGELESVRINRSSGILELDQYVLQTIERAAPFESFTDEIKKDTDVLVITKTWAFTSTAK